MRKLGLVVLAILAVGACSSGSGGGTATEQKLCADITAGRAPDVLYADANAVNNDLSTGADDLSLEALAFINAYDARSGYRAEIPLMKDAC